MENEFKKAFSLLCSCEGSVLCGCSLSDDDVFWIRCLVRKCGDFVDSVVEREILK